MQRSVQHRITSRDIYSYTHYRDLLQRHPLASHDARNGMVPLPTGFPTVAGPTQMACQHCANAKARCDKKVPCSRCERKRLRCSARFARKSSKAVARAVQASAALRQQMMPTRPQSPPPAQPVAFTNPDPTIPKQDSPSEVITRSQMTTTSPRTMEVLVKKSSPVPLHLSSSGVDGLAQFMQPNSDFTTPNTKDQETTVWPEHPSDVDECFGQLSMSWPGLLKSSLTELRDVSSSSASKPMTTLSSRGSIHTRNTSVKSIADFDATMNLTGPSLGMLSESKIPEVEVVIADEDSWPVARCNPPFYHNTCQSTAIMYLERLERMSKEHGTWSSLERYLENVDWDATDASVVPLTSRTRDRMLAILQSLFQKALNVNRSGIGDGYPKTGYATFNELNFIVLPPPEILNYFLRSYVRSFQNYYPFIVARRFDPNEMPVNAQASTLLLLLLIAQGAAAVPMTEARYLATGLTEACRISVFDIIEKEVGLSADPVVLSCALLCTLQGAWSGDKSLMDISIGQRETCLSVDCNHPPNIPIISSLT